MTKFKVGIIGCGRPWKTEGATGFGMAHRHAAGYEASPDCEIVAAADIKQENLEAFCEQHNIPNGYLDADEMLAQKDLDIVSICLWPHLHAPMVIKVAQAGVKAIHCEKPMATTFGDARKMVEVCQANDVVLTFNHQRRFGAPFRKAKELLDSGAIGKLERLEAFTSNLYDWGTHWFDMLFFYNDETPVEWVIGQIDARGGRPIFGAIVEGQGLSFFKWRNGVAGLMVTGQQALFQQGKDLRSIDCSNRLIGSEGMIEVGVSKDVRVRIRNIETGGQWKNIDVEGDIHGNEHHVKAVLDLVDALKTGREPELSGRKALQATELIFATYESSRKRGRVALPLQIEDSPFTAMLNHADMTTWQDDYVEANGITLHYYRTGGEDKRPFVLAHGFSDNALCWTPVVHALEREYDVIMYDARGHGQSDAPKDGYSIDDRADDLAGLIEALKLEKPVVLGHSMGASTVAQAAAKYPDLIGIALLEDPAWWNNDPRGNLSQEDIENQAILRRADILENKTKSRAALITECHRRSPTWDAAELGPWAQSKQQLSPRVIHLSGLSRQPWQDNAKKITCPTLLITADIDKGAIVTPVLAEEATALNDQIQVAHIKNAGHSIRREAFAAYMDALKRFLNQV